MWPRLGLRGLTGRRGLAGGRGLAVRAAVRPLVRAALASHVAGLMAQNASNNVSRRAIAQHTRALAIHGRSIRVGLRGFRASKNALIKNRVGLARGKTALAFHLNGFRNAVAAARGLRLM
jgi:hypothetical protein